MADMMFTSLAAMAEMDTTDIAVLKNRLQPAGIYIISFSEIKMAEAELKDADSKPRINMTFKGEIEMFQPLVNADGDSVERDLIGKPYNEFYTIWAEDLAESIGLLKGRYDAAHLSTRGKLGGDGVTAGWLDGVIGKRVAIRVTHKQKGDDTRVYYDWLGYKAMAKLDLPWDELGREPLDRNDNVIDFAA